MTDQNETDIAERMKLIAQVPLRLHDLFYERVGDKYHEMAHDYREFGVCGVPDLESFEGRVFIPMRELFEDVLSDKEGDEAAETYFRIRNVWLPTMVVSAWSLEKLVVAYDRSALGVAVNDAVWWRGFTTDWLLENFRPWCMFLSFGDGGSHEYSMNDRGGYFTGLDVGREGLVLFSQFVGPDGSFWAENFREFALTPGKTLGELVDEYSWDFPGSVMMQQRTGLDEEKRREIQRIADEGSRAACDTFFPMLVLAILDEWRLAQEQCCERIRLDLNLRTGVVGRVPPEPAEAHDADFDLERIAACISDPTLRMLWVRSGLHPGSSAIN
ncbi:hypothetical protein [Sutterella sp.]|uniref:hypothetical protein n=1 Tax=Sutterella sp. TaxID=1981025 RepID=UPI0026DF4E04|nr:hypothetical protein [Sutterella sp.]MDO5532861.1 hypothetical protein [Sutterella sp.]